VSWPPLSVGSALAVVVLVLAILLGLGILPFTVQMVAGCLALLAVARLT
jgi:hypothetical protein